MFEVAPKQFINGKQTVDVTDNCESKRAMSGVLALQLHAGGEEALDDQIMQVTGNAVAILVHSQALVLAPATYSTRMLPPHRTGEHVPAASAGEEPDPIVVTMFPIVGDTV